MLTIIFMLIRRLTASMKTSNSSKEDVSRVVQQRWAGGSPRHRIGLPMDSHMASSRQMVAKDFSPPLKERGSLSLLPCCVPCCSSVWTCNFCQQSRSPINMSRRYLELQRPVLMVKEHLSEVPTVGKMVLEYNLASECDVTAEVVPFVEAKAKGFLQSLMKR